MPTNQERLQEINTQLMFARQQAQEWANVVQQLIGKQELVNVQIQEEQAEAQEGEQHEPTPEPATSESVDPNGNESEPVEQIRELRPLSGG